LFLDAAKLFCLIGVLQIKTTTCGCKCPTFSCFLTTSSCFYIILLVSYKKGLLNLVFFCHSIKNPSTDSEEGFLKLKENGVLNSPYSEGFC